MLTCGWSSPSPFPVASTSEKPQYLIRTSFNSSTRLIMQPRNSRTERLSASVLLLCVVVAHLSAWVSATALQNAESAATGNESQPSINAHIMSIILPIRPTCPAGQTYDAEAQRCRKEF